MIIITDIELDLTGPTDMDLTDPLTMSVALTDDDNVSGSVFTDVDKDVQIYRHPSPQGKWS